MAKDKNTTEHVTPENDNLVTLENPIQRGNLLIEQVTVTTPTAGPLRGVSLAAVANSDVDALIKVLPRMTYPPLLESDVVKMELPDMVTLASKVIGFLSPSSVR